MKQYKKLVGYVRKSRAEHGKTEEELLNEQIKYIKLKSLEMEQEIDIYQEIGSGETIANRPEIKKVLGLLKNKYYDGLVVKDITRISRGSYADFEEIVTLIENYNVDIITQEMVFSDDQASKFMLRQRLTFSKEEIEMIKFRLQSGKKNAASRGKWMVTAAIPFGYIYDKNNKQQILEVHEQNAKLVQMMYRMVGENGTTMHAVKLKLKELKVKSPKGKEEWGHSTLKKILQNEVYLGTVIYNRSKWFLQENEKGMKINKKVARDESEIIRVPDAHEAIVSQELFDKVQEQLESRKSTSTVPSSFELSELAYLVRCARGCGRTLSKKFYKATYTKKDGTKSYYPKRFLYCMDCEHSLRYDDILGMIVKELKDIQFDEEKMKKYYNEIELFKEDNEKEIDYIKIEIEKEKSKMDNQRNLFFDSMNDDKRMYPESTFKSNAKISLEKIDALTDQLTKLMNQEKIEYKVVKKSIKENIKNFLDLYERAPSSSYKNEVLRAIIDYVEVEVLVEPKAKQPALYDISLYLQKGLFI